MIHWLSFMKRIENLEFKFSGKVVDTVTFLNGTPTSKTISYKDALFVTSDNAASIVNLPPATLNRVIYVKVGANGFHLVTNALDTYMGGGTNLTVPATTCVRVECIAANVWVATMTAQMTIS